MAMNLETLAKKLGATLVGTVPDYSPGAFGIATLANTRSRPLATLAAIYGSKAN